jgi:hypothetical protein
MVTTVPAAIHEYALNGKGRFKNILAAITVAGKDYARFMKNPNKSNLTKDEKTWLEEIKRRGYDEPQYTRDAIGVISSLHGKLWTRLMRGSMWLFARTEQWNRGATLLAAYRLARKQGYNETEAKNRARTAMEKAHAIYGKATWPEWTQGTNPSARIGQMLYLYSKFGHNWLQMLYELGVKKKNYKAFIWGLASPIVLGGAASIPLKNVSLAIIAAIMKAMGDDRDPEKMVWDGIRENLGPKAEKAFRYGLVGIAGADISGSFAVDPGVPKNMIELTGAIGGVIGDFQQAWRYLETGQFARAFEVALPTGAGRMIQAEREREEGATTRTGRRIFDVGGKPYMPTTGETLLRAAGFRTAKRATVQARQWEIKKQRSRFAKRRTKIYEEYRAYLASKDKELLKKVIEDIKKYNQKVIEAGLTLEIPPITRSSLRRQLRRMMKPSKRDVLR